MRTYEGLLIEYEKDVKVKEGKLTAFKGLYKNKKILINSQIRTNSEKASILAEELGHHFTSSGDIIDTADISNMKQELRARAWGYEKLVGLVDLITAYRSGIKDKYELAEFLNVPLPFLEDAIDYYKGKYGTYYKLDNYLIYFSPNFGVLEFL